MQALPLNTVMVFRGNKCTATEKFMLRCQLMKTVFCGFFCLLLYYAYGQCSSFELASVGIFTWTQRNSASKIYSMKKYNVTIKWLVNTQDSLDLTK